MFIFLTFSRTIANNFNRCISIHKRYIFNAQSLSLESLGSLQNPSINAYEPGQLFIHKHFGYRGIILHSWVGKLYDRNDLLVKSNETINYDDKKIDFSNITVYQALTDQRDVELCNSSFKHGITFLPDDKRIFNTIYIVSGMDYLFHDDIIPYVPQQANPLVNDYFGEFFLSTPDKNPPFTPTDSLRRWIEMRKQSLEVTSVNREVTDGIRVTTIPFFMGRRYLEEKSDKQIRYWRYIIRLENLTQERVQLRERFWKVFSVNGNLESIRGKGVVGMQPTLCPDTPVFQYHSHVQVHVPWAHMWGSYRFENSNGSNTDVKIPSFPLCDRACWNGEVADIC